MPTRTTLLRLAPAALLPLVMGAQGDCGNINSREPAPDVSGEWGIEYDDVLGVEITIGGSTYTRELGAVGGVVSIDHDGVPFEFELDCARADVLCPSEAWPAAVRVEQREPQFPSRMWVTLPTQTCTGRKVAADPSECGPDTSNPDCEDVCEGEVRITEQDVFGVIGASGQSFRLSLGGGLATNGINCGLLGLSFADADLVSEGSAAGGDWRAVEMTDGVVSVNYSGGCLWVGDPDADRELEALAIAAQVSFTTGFVGARLD